MNLIKFTLVLVNMILNTEASFLNIFDEIKLIPANENIPDAGPGVFKMLTKLIQNERNVRQYASVNFTAMPSVESYSGFLTVNKTCDSNLFFWYFPSENNKNTAPLIVWLQGEPGASSILHGVFKENGPFEMKNKTLSLRKNSWTLFNHMLYIDSPVGAGYSFTSDSNCYAKNILDVSTDLYEAISQFFKIFPELRKNDFYIASESYGGKYVTAFGYEIHEHNIKAEPSHKINLQGLIIGSGLCDPFSQLGYNDYLYHIGLIDSNQKKVVKEMEDLMSRLAQIGSVDAATQLWIDFFNNDPKNMNCLLNNLTGLNKFINYLTDKTEDDVSAMYYVQRNDFRFDIHVGDKTFNDGKIVVDNLKLDIFRSVTDWILYLLPHYRFLFYNGQLDIIAPAALTENYLNTLELPFYDTAPRVIWRVGNDVAGYVKTAGNLTQALVRNAGHLVAFDKPIWVYDLINKFTRQKGFN